MATLQELFRAFCSHTRIAAMKFILGLSNWNSFLQEQPLSYYVFTLLIWDFGSLGIRSLRIQYQKKIISPRIIKRLLIFIYGEKNCGVGKVISFELINMWGILLYAENISRTYSIWYSPPYICALQYLMLIVNQILMTLLSYCFSKSKLWCQNLLCLS